MKNFYSLNKKCRACSALIANQNQSGICRACYVFNFNRETYKNNTEEIKALKKLYYNENKKKVKQQKANYYLKSKVKIAKYRQNNKENINNSRSKYERERKKKDINFKLCKNLRSYLSSAIRGNYKSGSAIQDLGCSINKLRIHLQLKFHRNPREKHEYMTWNNWSRNGWHIDHIKPLSSFDLEDPRQFKEACHYTNLQPMWAKDNIVKSNKTGIVINKPPSKR